jgi:hypothetical protein
MLKTGNPVFVGDSTAVDFTLSGHRILVPVHINGSDRDFTFFLDTCGSTIIDLSVAGELNIKRGGEIRLNDDSPAFLSKKKVNVRLGDFEVTDLRILMLDLHIFNHSSDLEIHGFLGSDFLRHFRVTFDYMDKRLVLAQSKTDTTKPSIPQDRNGSSVSDAELNFGVSPANAEVYRIPITKRYPLHWPIVQCRLDRRKDVELYLDTGSPYTIVAPVSLIENKEFTPQGTCLESEGILVEWPGAFADSIERNYLSRLESFRIGDLELFDLPVIYANCGSILLGRSFFTKYLMTIDYPANELSLAPMPDSQLQQDLFSTGLGLKKEKSGRIIVTGFWKGSPADEQGLEIGDEVLSVNTIHAEELSNLVISKLLNDDNITVVNLVIKDDESEKPIFLEKRMLFTDVLE